jgi:hypothetical protein
VTDVLLYQVTILMLLVAGLVPALIFIGQHRPRQWRRLEAWDASGWVVIVALTYVRSLVLLVTRWPGLPPKGTVDAVFAIGTLLFLDVVLIVRVMSYRSFKQRDDERIAEGREDAIT